MPLLYLTIALSPLVWLMNRLKYCLECATCKFRVTFLDVAPNTRKLSTSVREFAGF